MIHLSPSENCLKPQKSGSKWLPRRSHPLPEAACQLSRRSIFHSPTQSDRSSRSAGEMHCCRFWSISCCWWFRWYVDQNGSQFLLSFSILNAAVYACQALLGENTLHACWFPNWLAADSKNWSSALNLQLRVLWIAIIAPERKSTKYHQKYCTEFPKKLRKQAIKPHKSQSLGVGFLWGKYVAS